MSETGQGQTVQYRVPYLSLMVIIVASNILSIYAYDRFLAVKIAIYDYPSLVKKVTAARMANLITEEQALQKIGEEAGKDVNSMPPNYVVFSADVLLGDSKKMRNVRKIEIPSIP